MIDLNSLSSLNLNSGVNVINNLQMATNTNFSTMMTGAMGTTSMDSIFEEASSTYNVPINLIKAVAKAESNFNADAVSSAGAQGVMQLMPKTAESLGVNNSFDAYENIMGGTKYLGQLLDKYDGDVTLALAGYNAGMGNVAKYDGVPPFTETKNYIEKVMDYAQMDINETGTYNPSQSFSLNFSGSNNDSYSDIYSLIYNFQEYTMDEFLQFLEVLSSEMSATSNLVNYIDALNLNVEKFY